MDGYCGADLVLCAPCPPPTLNKRDFWLHAASQNITERDIGRIATRCNVPDTPVVIITTRGPTVTPDSPTNVTENTGGVVDDSGDRACGSECLIIVLVLASLLVLALVIAFFASKLWKRHKGNVKKKQRNGHTNIGYVCNSESNIWTNNCTGNDELTIQGAPNNGITLYTQGRMYQYGAGNYARDSRDGTGGESETQVDLPPSYDSIQQPIGTGAKGRSRDQLDTAITDASDETDAASAYETIHDVIDGVTPLHEIQDDTKCRSSGKGNTDDKSEIRQRSKCPVTKDAHEHRPISKQDQNDNTYEVVAIPQNSVSGPNHVVQARIERHSDVTQDHKQADTPFTTDSPATKL